MNHFKNAMRSLFALVLAAAFLAPTAQADQMGYNDGFFVKSADDDFKFQFNSLFQAGYVAAYLDGPRANASSLNINAARFRFSGHAFGPQWTYLIETEAATGVVALLDWYANYESSDAMNIRVGEFRVPYSREFLTYLGHQQFASRSLLGSAFNGNVSGVIGRETGVSVWGQLAEEVFEYYLTVTNGNGAGNAVQGTVFGGGDIDFRYTLRMVYQLMGNHGNWYSDVDMSEESSLALGAGVNWNRTDIDGDAAFDDTIGLTADLVYAGNGVSAAVEYHLVRPDGSTVGDTLNHSVLAQAGYFFNEAMELAARVAWLAPDGGNTTIKPGVVFNYYIAGNNVKVQAQYEFTSAENLLVTDDAADHDFILQLQFML